MGRPDGNCATVMPEINSDASTPSTDATRTRISRLGLVSALDPSEMRDVYKHTFLRRPYLKADGMPAQYSPDFLVRTAFDIYVVETKAQSSLDDANVRRKEDSARGWCGQINALPPALRDDRDWNYVLLGEKSVKEWRDKGASASQLLAYAK